MPSPPLESDDRPSPRPGRLVTRTCRQCEQDKPSREFYLPGARVGGPPLRMCRDCRAAGIWWCNFHDAAHDIAEFAQRPNAPEGAVRSDCRRALVERQWKARGQQQYTCEACGIRRPAFDFTHVVRGYHVCAECCDSHPAERWCRGCGWQPLDLFGQSPSAKTRGARDVRCDPCAQAHKHGTTVVALLALQGSTVRECASCGDRDDLQVDHDHRCCDDRTTGSCGECVRGYLCSPCNRAEGVLRTVARAEALVAYMRRWERARPGEEQTVNEAVPALEAIPTSSP